MRRFMIVAIPIAAIAIFILIMQSGGFLKYSFGNDDNIPQEIEKIIQDIISEDWEAADKNTDKLKKAWDKVVSRVQFSSERDEINTFSVNIARLEGAILAKDRSSAILELKEAYEHWNDLGK